MKKIIIIVVAILVVASLIGNGYFLFDKWLAKQKSNSYNAGFITAVNQLYNQAKTGELILKNLILKDGKLEQVNPIKLKAE